MKRARPTMWRGLHGAILVALSLWMAGAIPRFVTAESEGGRVLYAGPKNYLSTLRTLKPGDTLVLEAGSYDVPEQVPGLPVFNVHGEPERRIVIKGPDTGPRPVLLARSTHNTVRIADASYVTIANLELDGRGLAVHGVVGQGVSHDIMLENLTIRNHGANQQIVGISTKAPAWRWTVRRSVIEGAGTGMYFGDSDGTAPFVAGLIEHNLIVDSVGYNLQIKHQRTRPTDLGLPNEPSTTIIRHNVFSKQRDSARGAMARPNLLVGHFPLAGGGANDRYAIYGNFFYQNSSGECLFQGEGNIAFYSNLLVNRHGDGVCVQPHNDVPRAVDVFRNTVLAIGVGIRVRGDPRFRQVTMGNAVFAAEPIRANNQHGNVTDSYTGADKYLVRPRAPLGRLNLAPRVMLADAPLIMNPLRELPDVDFDFAGYRYDAVARGAYRQGAMPNWLPQLAIKPAISQKLDAQ